MKKRVYNKTFGKIVRTLGFLMVLASSLLFTAMLIDSSTASFLSSLQPMVTQIIDMLPTEFYHYLGLGYLVGLLLLIWAIRRGFVLRVLITIVLIGLFIIESFNMVSFLTGYAMLTPTWLGNIINSQSALINQLLDISPWIAPGVALLAVMLLWGVFANARPKRFSLFLFRIATITLFLGVVVFALQYNLSAAFVTADWYVVILDLLYIISYALIAVGALFGTIGFYRK